MTTPDQYLLRTFNWTGLGDTGVTTALPSGAISSSGGIYTISYAFLETLTEANEADYTPSDYYSYAVAYEHDNFYSVSAVQEHEALVVMGLDLDTDYSFADFYGNVAPVSFAEGTYESSMITFGQINDTSTDGFFGSANGNSTSGLTYNYNATTIDTGQSTDDSVYGNIWFNKNFTLGWSSADPGSDQFHSILHEIGHALGLKHPQDSGDGAGQDPNSGDWDEKYTIMYDTPQGWSVVSGSYVAGTNAMYNGSSTTPLWAYGLQINDIAAIQDIYGREYGTRDGDTLYDFGSGLGRAGDASNAFIYAIWDGGGTNVIDTTGFSGDAKIDLRQGEFSSIGSNGNGQDGFDPITGRDIDNVSIAYYTVIQNAIGAGGNDTLIGNSWNNVLYGAGGNDKIYGDGAGYDTHIVVNDYDTGHSAPASDLSGDDILIGGAGNDYFYGGLGNDVIHGGYAAADITGAVSGWDAAGQFTGTNNASATVVPDIAYSADGNDTTDYSNLPDGTSGDTGIDITFGSTGTVDLASVVKGHAGEYGTDTLFSIEAVQGTPWNDTFEGTGLEVSAIGSTGNDTYTFFATGPVIGGSGINYSSLDSLSAHIAVTFSGSGGTVDKSNGGGSLGEDTLSTNVHSIVGTSADDTFAGMIPAGGETDFIGGAGNDTYSFNMNDLLADAPHYAVVLVTEDTNGSLNNVSVSNYDSVAFDSYAMYGSTAEIDYTYQAWNSAISAYDYLYLDFLRTDATGIDTVAYGSTTYEFGGYTDDTFTAATGVHLYDGGSGLNTIDYSAATGGINVNLLTGTASDNGWGYTDTLQNIATVLGSGHDDSITGDGGSNVLNGGAGNDTIVGGAGDDTLLGGSGNDSLDGGSGTDTADFSTSAHSVAVYLYAGLATGDGTDTLTNIENVTGSPYVDFIYSDAGDNVIDGGGAIAFNGGDVVSYQAATSAVTVDLVNGTATGDGSDTLLNIASVIGSPYDDTLIGDGTGFLIRGSEGFVDGMAGNDTLEGGTIDYGYDPAGVTVNLTTGTAIDGWGDTDTLIDVHAVFGSPYDDTIIADASALQLSGGTGGSDTYVFSTGFGNTLVIENIGGAGTDTIHFTGIDPADIRMYTDSSGYLYLQDITNPSTSISLFASTTGSGTDESNIGQFVEQITFDDVNSTVWSLTGGLTLTGTTSAESLYGTAYGDVINGMGGADTIFGNGGNDTISSGSGNDILDGGAGTDTVSYAGATAAVTVNLATTSAQNTVGAGTDTITNFENLTGSAFNDTLTGDGNANTIDGGAGNDIMDGAAGTDTLSYASATAGITISLAISTGQATGGSGTDTISNFENLTGSAFGDTLTGDANANVIDGGAGNDIIQGGAGNDVLTGGLGTDTLTYAAAASAVTVNLATTTGQNTVGAGTDTISGFENLTGSAFNDSLTGDGNDNVIEGLAGNDVMVGGAGTDTVSYASATAGVTVNLATTTAQNTVGAGTDTISGFENLTGSGFADTLTGDANANVIDGGAGNDVMNGAAGTDTLSYASATAGITISLAITTAQATGGSGSDTISNFENLTGSAFNDTLTGDANANTIDGGAGNDVIQGGAGNDVLIGGSGIDTLTYAAAASAVTVNLATTSAQVTGGAGTDTISGFENLTGSGFADTLTGDTNANTISGGAGNDIIAGSGGADVLDGGAGTDTVDYSAAAAGVTVNLATGTATNDGDGSSDTLTTFENITGSAHDDNLTGDGNANAIIGGAGNDIIQGGAGNDVLTGGTGTDTVTYSAATAGVTVNLTTTTGQNTVGAGTDTITGFENLTGSGFADTLTGDGNNNVIQGLAGNDVMVGGSGTDTVTYVDAASAVTVSLATTSAQNTVGAGTDTISGFENLTGSAFNDTLGGDANANVIDGGAGTDTVTFATAAAGVTVDLSAGTATGDGSDTLINIENVIGSSHNDVITGNSGNNVLDGGAGNDTLDGGGGTDTVTFNASATMGVTVDLHAGTATGAGSDTLLNIENVTGTTHNDTIGGSSGDNVLDGGGGTDTVSYASAASHVTVNLSTGTATGDGTDTLSNFVNAIGSAYNDTITGDTNVNTLTGGAGDDTMTGGGGADLLYGGTGSDTFLFLAAHALSAIVKIEDFTSGSGNDKIDLKDVISSYDPATMAITDWVQITTSGSDSIVKVDIDGTGSAHTWQQIATIVGVTGLTDEAALVASGNLIAH